MNSASKEDPKGDRGEDPTPEELKLELARTQERLAATERERDGLAERLDRLVGKQEELQQEFSRQQVELGRLQQVEAGSDELRRDRDALRSERDEARGRADDLRREIDEVRTAIPEQVRSQLDDTIGQVNQAHADEVEALRAEREQLRGRITELEQGAEDSAPPAMTTTGLAGHFADVLADLGNRPATGGRAFAAALTGLNVEAKGLLRTNEQGDVEIIAAQPGTAPAEQLSTVQMELKLLPRLPETPPGTS
ncbi:hypothetical protein [Actinoplanes sp. NPDC049265]|uniref:hypothetical protein n=1 Tax=Actinoplanes sp. NPDC049265 TaxID=3363902 RepID=UPI00371D6F0A